MIPKGGNDNIQTPDDLALAVVRHFEPRGNILEPCSGDGAFLRAFRTYEAEQAETTLKLIHSFEITEGTDFLKRNPPELGKYDWIITNEPWSLYRPFLEQSFRFARNVVFLDKLNAFFSTKARFNLVESAGYWMQEVALVAQPPPPWAQMGFQLAAVHFCERHPADPPHLLGHPIITRLDYTPEPQKKPL
jgi:hypothetical protein